MKNLFDPTQPLGLPAGSVRAIIALTVVIFTVAHMSFTGVVTNEELVLLGSVMAAYKLFKGTVIETVEGTKTDSVRTTAFGDDD